MRGCQCDLRLVSVLRCGISDGEINTEIRIPCRLAGGSLAAAVGTKWRVGGGKGREKRPSARGVIRVEIK
jgi:hypothetical protein